MIKQRFFHETGLEKRSRRENSSILREISFRIFLASNKSTRYQWFFKKHDREILGKYQENIEKHIGETLGKSLGQFWENIGNILRKLLGKYWKNIWDSSGKYAGECIPIFPHGPHGPP